MFNFKELAQEELKMKHPNQMAAYFNRFNQKLIVHFKELIYHHFLVFFS